MNHIKLKLIAVIFLASLVRLAGLGSWPQSLYWEEAALGYDAYSIWKTGKDLHGNRLPVVAFESFGDYKPSGYFYLAAPVVGIFGLNEWSVRLPSAILGILTVYLTYLIGTQLFDKNKGILGAFSLAILPWHIHFSRAAFEVNTALFELTLGVYLILVSRRKSAMLILAAISLAISMYTYHGLRVLAPLLAGLTIFVFNIQILKTKWFWISAIVGLLMLTPILNNLNNPVVSKRFSETSLFSTSQSVIKVNTWRDEDGMTTFSRIIHHRYLEWLKEIVIGMLSHFSANFLLLTGDGNQRHQTGFTGLIYWWCLFALVAVFSRIRKFSKKAIVFLTGWIILATIPPALTNTTPHTLRFLASVPAFCLLIGAGMDRFINQEANKRFIPFLILAIAGEFFIYGFDYLTSYPKRSAPDWQDGYRQAVNFIRERNNPSELVQVTRNYGRPSIYFLYYLKVDPNRIQSQNYKLPKDQGELLAFDNYRFGPINQDLGGIAVSETELTRGKLLQTIMNQNNQPVFYIYEL